MNKKIFHLVVASILALGLTSPGIAMAKPDGIQCLLQGTWFGVNDLENKVPNGWVATVTGMSANHGVNVLEFPQFDTTFGGTFPVKYQSANRGIWRRTGGRTFEYSFMSIAAGDVAAGGREDFYYMRVSGDITLSEDCMSEEITAVIDFFPAGMSPFENAPVSSEVYPTHYGYRSTLDVVTHTFP